MNIIRSFTFIFLSTCLVQLSSAKLLPDPERYEETIQNFEQQDRLNPPPEGAIVLTGVPA